MADFKVAYDRTAKIEGGYANTPGDSGGETWRGIARNYHPKWTGWSIIDSFKPISKNFETNLRNSQTLQRLVLEFYKEEFWDVMCLDQVQNQDIANEMYDTGVNMDPRFPIEFLQKALNVTNRNGKEYPDVVVDGKMGAKTVAALNAHPRPKQILTLLNCQQGTRYMDIARSNPIQEKFMTSWLSRVVI
jgi:lysozyme family protein